MKTKLITMMALAGMFIVSCGEKAPDDSKEAAQDENKEKMKEDVLDNDIKSDIKFAETAADDGMFEVQAADLAKTSATSAEVKTFAEQMAKDHGAANEELKKVAAEKNISIPTSISDDKQNKYGKLAEKKGTDFDKAYVDMMVDAHKDAVSLFEKEAEKGEDMQLRDWAAQKLPVLRHHLQMAEDMQNNMDNKK